MTNHQHTNIQSDDTCCTPDLNAVNQNKNTQSKQTESESGISREWLSAIASFILLAAGLVLDNWIQPSWFEKTVRFAWYAVAYVPVGLPVLFKGIRIAFRGDMFTEFILMSIATLGAFYIGEYPEGVAVMLFYAVGELFQDAAVNKAKRSIKALMDMRPDTANVFRNGKFDEVDPTNVVVGETIQIKVGERVPLDGEMLSDGSSFNTAALTGT